MFVSTSRESWQELFSLRILRYEKLTFEKNAVVLLELKIKDPAV